LNLPTPPVARELSATTGRTKTADGSSLDKAFERLMRMSHRGMWPVARRCALRGYGSSDESGRILSTRCLATASTAMMATIGTATRRISSHPPSWARMAIAAAMRGMVRAAPALSPVDVLRDRSNEPLFE
jgi:hypothetical protein